MLRILPDPQTKHAQITLCFSHLRSASFVPWLSKKKPLRKNTSHGCPSPDTPPVPVHRVHPQKATDQAFGGFGNATPAGTWEGWVFRSGFSRMVVQLEAPKILPSLVVPNIAIAGISPIFKEGKWIDSSFSGSIFQPAMSVYQGVHPGTQMNGWVPCPHGGGWMESIIGFFLFMGDGCRFHVLFFQGVTPTNCWCFRNPKPPPWDGAKNLFVLMGETTVPSTVV